MSSARVLIVEDNPVNQLILRKLLAREGVLVEVAGNGVEGVSRASEGGWHLVLMDLQMPVMDGFEATRRIRALDGAVGHVPIVAITANTQPEDRLQAASVGMNDFIAKPVNMGVLRSALARWLGGRIRASYPSSA